MTTWHPKSDKRSRNWVRAIRRRRVRKSQQICHPHHCHRYHLQQLSASPTAFVHRVEPTTDRNSLQTRPIRQENDLS
ncbi:hypothetical protein EMPS_02943 [Entomortierella parvispora]|uniref:Uncharacterized protein n=1 Tax=Entomortierella parvispora TaxID=205924 RepID=A0A9P3H5V0_9FUNG|nr:hypothetical protein EMPS_02943 [Entomortierella parvispora]